MKILVVGISVRALVESAINGCYPVIALDAFGDRDLKAQTEAYSLHHDFHVRYSSKELYRASREFSFDAVTYTSNLENHPDIIRRFGEDHKIIGNSPQTVESARHWPALFKRLKQAGFSVPDTIFAGDSRKTDSNRLWLIKPLLSGGGHGITFFDGRNSPGDAFMIQEYIYGKPCSASFLANGRECVVLGIAEQIIGARQFGSHDFRYCGNILPLPEILYPDAGQIILDQVRRLAAFLTEEYSLTGVNGIDFILSDNRVYLTEVNPRYSASMELIEQAYEQSIFHLHLQAVLDSKLPEFSLEDRLNAGTFYGKAILFAEQDAVMPDTNRWLAGAIRDVPASGDKLNKGNPICTILNNSPTYDETFADLVSRAGMLKKEIYR
jgi:predicted ATP-grasp superfamily ATP-dependent carboligase